jgi:hypothetical protein
VIKPLLLIEKFFINFESNQYKVETPEVQGSSGFELSNFRI